MSDDATTMALRMIIEERQRQIDAEGYTAAHDDTFRSEELADAAACYADPDPPMTRVRLSGVAARTTPYVNVPMLWPWDVHSWKPCPQDRKRELVKAGALVAAELARLLRLEGH